MKTIDKKELFENLGNFLKAKGIELKDGSYAQGIEKACSFLTDAINLGQMGLERAKEGLDRNVERVRQVIHEKTAPRTPPTAGPTASASADASPTATGPSSAPTAQPAAATTSAGGAKSRRARARKSGKSRKPHKSR